MVAEITSTPATIQAGDTLSWLITLDDYPASDGWGLTYVLINSAGKIEISSIASGDAHKVGATAAETSVYAAGTYSYVAQVAKDAERLTVERGSIDVLADFSIQESYDARSTAAITLANIDAVLSGKAGSDSLAYTINGRSLSRYTWEDLIAAKKYFQGVVNQEAAALAGTRSNKVVVKFTTPGMV